MKNLTLGEMKAMNEKAGQSWFKPTEMRFFGTIIEAMPNTKDVFITSEWKDFSNTTRGYSLRLFDRKTGTVETVGEFNEYNSLQEARDARKLLTKVI